MTWLDQTGCQVQSRGDGVLDDFVEVNGFTEV